MFKKIVALGFPLLALLLATVTASSAVPLRTPGVHAGEWFKYGDISIHWNSNDPNATIPPGMENLNETGWMLYLVQSVVGTNITANVMTHYNNGTDVSDNGWVDVDSGNGNLTMFFVAADLGVNDSIYSSGTYSTLNINETISTIYPGGARQTNHLNVTMDYSYPPSYNSLNVEIWWDKVTGALTQISEFGNQTMTYTTTYSVSVRLIDTGSWVVPEFPSFLILPLFMITTLSAVIVYKRKREKLSPATFAF
jgi:hypothetical protein